MQLGDSAVRGQQKGIRGDGNHIHRIAGATVGFPKRGNASFGRKFPVPIPFPFDPDAIEVRRPPDGTLPGERARHESVIVKKAADRLELPPDPIRVSASVGGPARRPGDVEVVAPRVSNRLAGFGECFIEEPYRCEHLASAHVRGKPVPVAHVRFEEVDVPGIQRCVVLGLIWGLLQRMTPRNARRFRASRYLGDATEFPSRRIPIEVRAEDREVRARMTDELGKPRVSAQRLRWPEERKLSHRTLPPASDDNDRRLPQSPSSLRRSHWRPARRCHPRGAPRARPPETEAAPRAVHPARDGTPRRCNTRAAPNGCSSADHRTSLRFPLYLPQRDECLLLQRRMPPRPQQPPP